MSIVKNQSCADVTCEEDIIGHFNYNIDQILHALLYVNCAI